MPICLPSLVPYQRHIGALLGGHFQLGPLVRQDLDGDVYSASAVDDLGHKLEAKAYILNGISKRQRRAKMRSIIQLKERTIASINQARRRFIIYKEYVPSESRIDNAKKSISNHFISKGRRGRRAAKLPRTQPNRPASEKPGEFDERKDRLQQEMVHQPKVQRLNHAKRSGKVESRSKNVCSENEEKKEPEFKTNPAVVLALGAVPSLQEAVAPQPPTKRRRNRGLKKPAVPYFYTCTELHAYIETLDLRLANRKDELDKLLRDIKLDMSPNVRIRRRGSDTLDFDIQKKQARQKRLMKAIALVECQRDVLRSRHTRACKQQSSWEILENELEYCVDVWDICVDEIEIDRESSLYDIRKKPLFAPLWNSKLTRWLGFLSLLSQHNVWSIGELEQLDERKMWEIRQTLNGAEALYRRD